MVERIAHHDGGHAGPRRHRGEVVQPQSVARAAAQGKREGGARAEDGREPSQVGGAARVGLVRDERGPEPLGVGRHVVPAEVAAALAGTGVALSAAATGRSNLFAESAGVVLIDGKRIEAINLVDEAVTAATLAPFARVTAGQILATVKIIPFAAPDTAVARCVDIAGDGGPPLAVAAFAPAFVYPYHYHGSDVDAFPRLLAEAGAPTQVVRAAWYPS